MEDRTPYEDIPLESRAQLFHLVKKVPLAEILRKIHLDGNLQIIYQQVRGTRNITPLTLVQLCKAFNDWSAVELLFEELGLTITIHDARPNSGNLTLEVLEVTASVGRVNDVLATALADGRISADERARIAAAASDGIRQLTDVISTCAKGAKS